MLKITIYSNCKFNHNILLKESFGAMQYFCIKSHIQIVNLYLCLSILWISEQNFCFEFCKFRMIRIY